MSWMLWVVAGLAVYCVGFVVTFALTVRFCKYRGSGHRHATESYYGDTAMKDCNHWGDNPLPWAWPLVFAVGCVAAPFVGPAWGTYKACTRIERRLVARTKVAAR